MEYLIQLYRQELKQIRKEDPDSFDRIVKMLQNGMLTLADTMDAIKRTHIEYQLSQDQQLELI